ncbi:restriction endonuclease subunit S [Vibrio splendidus]|uniref:restriction endonuclease subunit S n=1 Tax=Vibrio splendidus TaxID=29497 RepID=UPI000C85EACC|nr:restriction endonuclease subunit S [Vibrio splendidus]PMI76282.1 restriction endonuclease subunit S [Vibrio splendidus]
MTVGKKSPEIRFKGFTGEWANKNIGDIFQVTSGATPLRRDARFFENADMSWVKTTDLNNGVILKTEEKISQIALVETSVKILPKGTVFVAMYGGFNQIGRTGLLETEATCNQALSAIYPNDKVVPYYLLTYLNLNVDAWKDLAASSRKDPNITKSDVLAFPFLYPSIKEQTKIGKHFQKLDSLINQYQQKHDKLSSLKRAMLEKMFPKQGETIPEIRFKGFSGEWEESSLAEEAVVTTGYPFDSADFSEDGDLLVITNGNIQNSSSAVDGKVGNRIASEKVTHLNQYKLNFGDILVTMDGSVGRTAKVIDRKQILAQRVGRLVARNDTEFLYQSLNTGAFLETMTTISHGGTIKHISLLEIGSYIVQVPKDLNEQAKVGNYFQKLDVLIAQHQQQITKLTNIKQACLSKMFV